MGFGGGGMPQQMMSYGVNREYDIQLEEAMYHNEVELELMDDFND